LNSSISGSAAEWNRTANIIFNNYVENSNHGKENWNDVFEIDNLRMQTSKHTNNPLELRKTISIQELYNTNVSVDVEQKAISNPYNLNDKCHKLKDFRAVHFSHVGCNFVKFCFGFERSKAVRKWYQSWLEQCKQPFIDNGKYFSIY